MRGKRKVRPFKVQLAIDIVITIAMIAGVICTLALGTALGIWSPGS